MLDRPTIRRDVVASGPLPADEVWDRYVRPRRWPEWSPQIRSVDYPADRLSPRTAGVVHGPFGLRVAFRILDVDELGPERSWSWSVSAIGVPLILRHTVMAIPAGTRTGLTVEGFAPVVLGYLPVARSALHRLVGPRSPHART
ncbi:hypothetical protein GCM10010435_82660 [Winogradskya consettensis]|uniref:Polyketide cyclase/dehydrase/lipid transport protein n=1 Tax=Winogradskya consettensis TaxID=113560 RepID=A0A919VW82_9ACTN|nr:SRPBCC family protein [Actinoplanes consettensis]GIM79181.1 hypothetical protein Aco04nite_64230 [Actinoplanes consettensis]